MPNLFPNIKTLRDGLARASKMVRNIGFMVAGIIVGMAALVMGTALRNEYHSDLMFAPDAPTLTAARAPLTKRFFRPGSGIDVGVDPLMTRESN